MYNMPSNKEYVIMQVDSVVSFCVLTLTLDVKNKHGAYKLKNLTNKH